jgi:hypothetical protein
MFFFMVDACVRGWLDMLRRGGGARQQYGNSFVILFVADYDPILTES